MEQRSVQRRSTTGDPAIRGAHVLAAPLQCFDFAEEIEALRRERPYVEQDRNAKTLVKSDAFRIVIAVLKAGARFDEDKPRGHVSILVRQGRVSLEVDDERTQVGTAQIAAIGAGHRWRAVAEEESVLVFHFSWPG
jgi:quercetin dioxygenase-like cupin family protein